MHDLDMGMQQNIIYMQQKLYVYATTYIYG